MAVLRLWDLPAGIDLLVSESQREGLEFVERLAREWRSRENCFDQPGEALFGSVSNTVPGALDAIGGINRDPYLEEPRVGRLRHVYVRPHLRNQSIGSVLVRAILEAAHGSFDRVRLRTASSQSDSFYERLGFLRVSDPTATHILSLSASTPARR
jgi:GNAT superfamily N-acetyltransferase